MSTLTPEFKLSAATLIMGLIKADGDIKLEEVDAAYSYIRNMSGDASERPWTPGDNVVLGRTGGNRIAEALGALRYSPEEDRLDLLAALWDVAAADGDIHEMESEFVQSAAEALNISPSTVEIVRPANLAAVAERMKSGGQRNRLLNRA